MKKHIYILLLFVPPFLWAQSGESSIEDIDLSDVVEINEPAVDGVSVDVSAPDIPEVTEALPSETEIVLELPGQGSAEVGSATMGVEETITVDFPDEDVRTILRNVADLFDLNLVIPDTLQGRTSLKLTNVTWRQVFEIVLEQQAFTYIEDRNIIRIKSIEEITTEPVDTRVFVVSFARAGELESSIKPLIDTAAGGRIQVDIRSNALVITERPSRMNKIQEIVDRLDKATDQVMIESKFIEVTNTDTKNLGINWSSLSGYNVSAGPFQRSVTDTGISDRSSSLSGTGTSVDFINEQGALAGQTTVPFLGGGPIYPAPSNIDDINAALASGDSPGSPTFPIATYDGLGGTSTFTDAISDVKQTIDTALFSADEFEVILSALRTDNDVELVSNPTVVTLNNTPAKIAIGERYPIPAYSFNSETGSRQLDDIEYEDIGINLDVTPQVNSAGFINLNIVPEVSSTNGFAIIESTQIPIIESRRTESSIMIKDGYTLAIGGLTENNIVDNDTKVPVLGDLPGVGRFFRSESDTKTARNLIIFITAKTLNPDGSTYEDVVDPRVLNEMGITPSEIPGYKLTPEEETAMKELQDFRESTEGAAEIRRLQEKLAVLQKAEEMRLLELEKASGNVESSLLDSPRLN
ncbi:MAG: secretin N-terminal domain-containing protein [Verrucomicrobiota bacterium]